MANTYDLNGKFAIVTGAAKGIGKAIAELLVQSGADVVAWDLNPVDVASVRTSVIDVTNVDSIRSGLAKIGTDQSIDLLINSAGYLGGLTPFIDQSATGWRRILEVNLVGTLQVTQAVLPTMLRQRSGRIINLGSLAGKEGLAGLTAYSAASAGVIAFTKALSREVAKDNVFVNCVAPGPIDTDMIRGLGAEVVARMVQDSPTGRLGSAGEVAQLVAWMCSEASQFNTGAIFDMSGGRARY
ncbi:MAG: SDR family NAD(P)-dependent oxidoreductase [Pseudomonadota bacterium]